MPRLGALALVLGSLVLVSCHHAAPPPQAPAPPPAAPSPPPPAPPPAAAQPSAPPPNEYSRIRAMDVDAINRVGLLEDIHFDFDKADIREVDRAVLAKDADSLKRYDFLKANIEGHCDERGTVEYNLALGERRAGAMRDYVVSLGVASERLRTVSYGKEVPLCTDHDEACWARNRRAHPSVTGKTASR